MVSVVMDGCNGGARFDAKDIINNIDVNELIQIAILYASKEKSLEEIAIEYGPKYRDAAIAYAEAFGKEKVLAKVKELLSNSNNLNVQELATDEFSGMLVSTALESGILIKKFFCHEIDGAELMIRLGNGNVTTVAKTLLKAHDLDLDAIAKNIETIGVENIATIAISYACFMETYKIYMKCLEDASIQHDHRVLIEQKCAESIAAIQEYRRQMEDNINLYFSEKYDSFEKGIVAMNEAIIQNDSDGYIKGCNEIQRILGYQPQFNNQEEFDDLMESDMDFKL